MTNITPSDHQSDHFDMIIIGAGLSGIGMACHYTEQCPEKSYCILEARENMGGTWDLFRYPGIRSDSDMYTLGYRFKPWTQGKSIADGPSILNYIREAATEYKVEQHIRYQSEVIKASWSSQHARWALTIRNKRTDKTQTLTCHFLSFCAGYYDYDQPFRPDFPGKENFAGTLIHPQHWPENLDYTSKHIVVIGSGATAVTLLPSLTDKAAHVTMLQRTPSYIVPVSNQDIAGNLVRAILPDKAAYRLIRIKNILYQYYSYNQARNKPKVMKKYIANRIHKHMGKSYDLSPHFTPDYNPWDQRACLTPDGDFYQALKTYKADVVTGQIDRFTQNGIALKDGIHLNADIIITATGLAIKVMGGVNIEVDGQPVNPSETIGYKGLMFSGVPNLVSVFGYLNASWTLRADLISDFVCRLTKHMEDTGTCKVMPVPPENMPTRSWMDFQSGYIQRALHILPKQGDRDPWLNDQNYLKDRKQLLNKPFDDKALQFSARLNNNKDNAIVHGAIAAE